MKREVSRRRLRFSLRTLLVVVTLAAVWLSYQWHWIHQRRAIFDTTDMRTAALNVRYMELGGEAPWSIRLLGEPGYSRFICAGYDREEQARIKDQMSKLFPEADVVVTQFLSAKPVWLGPKNLSSEPQH